MTTRRDRLSRRLILASLAIVLSSLMVFALATATPGRPNSVVPTWGPNVRANSDDSGWGQHEPHLAISRTDPNVVVAVAKDYRDGNEKQVWIYVSQDGGQTWPLEKQLQIPGMPGDIPLQSDPVTMARDDGRIYVIALGYGDGHGLFITWTDDNGETWQDPSVQITYNETPGGLDDKEWLAIDNNPASPYYHNMYVAWANGGILFKRSSNGGETWSSYMNIAPGSTEYPYPVVAADGTLYVFYMDGWGYCADGWIRYRKSTDGGQTFTGPYSVTQTSQPCSPIHGYGGYDQWRFFSIITAAADPNNPNNLWTAWTDDNDVTYGKTDVLYVRSTDGGSTWSDPERLSHDDPEAYVDHITPVFSIGADNRLHAFWLDRREDPDNILFHGWHTSTPDGGITWEPDSRVSEQSFDLNIGFPPGSNNAAGDYWGLDTVGNIVMAAWNTTIYGEQDIFVARGVFSTTEVTLTGLVSDATTALPIENALVVADMDHSSLTGPDGVYTMSLPSGVYTITAQASGYISQTIPDIELITGTAVLDFALAPIPIPVTITGQVSDAQSASPIEGAQVAVDPDSVAFTDPSGFYQLSLEPGIYTVTASASGYFSETIPDVELLSGTVTLDFALEPVSQPVTLTGQVSDALITTPIAGALIEVPPDLLAYTDANGNYMLSLSPGIYTVTASASGYISQTIPSIEAVSGTVTLDFSLIPLICPAPVIQAVHVITDGLTVTFSTDVESLSPVTYLWEFGDGETSALAEPIHVYPGYAAYAVNLSVQNLCGSDSWGEQITLIAPRRFYYLAIVIR